uniref:Uncharacterized protein n=1 Tax=Poecilia latipinna TaxID=48699 RepID=A0A3B3UTW9_9TELE
FHRMDEDFRMEFLFQDVSSAGFISIFNEQQPKLLKFLDDVEQCAAQLEKMNKGAKISSITSSSVGAAGGVLSIVGLALIPVTAGLSVGLTIAGVSMGVTSGANSLSRSFLKRQKPNFKALNCEAKFLFIFDINSIFITTEGNWLYLDCAIKRQLVPGKFIILPL